MKTDTKISKSSAQPIREPTDIKRIREFLAQSPRDRLLFEMAIQTGLPISWLLKLRVADLIGLALDEEMVVRNEHGRRIGVLVMNETLHQVWQNYLGWAGPKQTDYVFSSSRSDEHLKLSTVTNLVSEWFKAVGLTGVRGVKSLRQTYEYHFAAPDSPGQPGDDAEASLNGLKPIRMVSAHETAYQMLLEAIVSGSILPGERLVPEKIAAQMKVSPMPVREALHRLREAGFVSTRSRGGMIVNKLSLEDLDEIQYIRLILERDAVSKATSLCGKDVIARLEKIHNDCLRVLRTGQIDLAVKYNKEFHLTIYRQAGMPIMAKIIEGLLDRIGPYIHIELKDSDTSEGHLKKSLGNHQKMLDSLRECDAEKLNHWLTLDHNLTTAQIRRIIEKRESDLRNL